jgi:hypothetical protein
VVVSVDQFPAEQADEAELALAVRKLDAWLSASSSNDRCSATTRIRPKQRGD